MKQIIDLRSLIKKRPRRTILLFVASNFILMPVFGEIVGAFPKHENLLTHSLAWVWFFWILFSGWTIQKCLREISNTKEHIK